MGSFPQLSILRGPTRKFSHKSLSDFIEELSYTEAANDTAIIFEDNGNERSHSYTELNKITNSLARVIKQTIVQNNLPRNRDGDYIIAVNLPPSDHLIIVLLAIWKAGAAYLPLDHAFPGPRIEHIIEESKPVIVIYDLDSAHYLETHRLHVNALLERGVHQCEKSLRIDERVQHLKDDLAIVLYTSGSTGIPKGVRLPHRVILNRLFWQFRAFPYNATEKICVFKTALTFVDSVAEIWGPLLKALCILVVPKSLTKDPEKLISLLDNYKIQRIVLVPSLLRSLLMYMDLERDMNILRNLKLWVCSGETLSVSLAIEFFKHFPENEYRLCNFYGSTEIMGDVTYQIITGPLQLKDYERVPIGLPLDNVVIYLLDNDYRPVKAGDVGELFVAGLNLAAGYVNGRDPDKFLSNPLAIDPAYAKLYRTGDFARLKNSALLYEGRTDSQVKIRGHRVDLAEVEKAITSLKGIDKAVVLCFKPGELNQALLAFVTTNVLISENQIEAMLKEKLTSYMIPQVILIESVPLLVNGKIDRQALLKMYQNTNNNDNDFYHADIDYTRINPDQMEAAKVLFETVASVLNRSARSAISLEANFYELGGNSLNSIVTISQLNEKGYRISIGDFIAAIDLGEVLERMLSGLLSNMQAPRFTSELCKPEHRDVVIQIITDSFYHKADLEQWILSEISPNDYRKYLTDLWEPLVDKRLSFVVRNDFGKIVAVAINFDYRDEPEVEIDSRLSLIFEYLEDLEAPFRDSRIPMGKGKTIHCHMMGTHSSLTTKENVHIIKFMEDEVYRLAKHRHFGGILTTNTNPLTQQLAINVLKFETWLDSQVNEFVNSDGRRPFGLAPDSQRALLQWKAIE